MQANFSDTLTAANVKHHIPHQFDVPVNCTQLTINLHFEPAQVDGIRNMLTLTLFDPSGFRGAGHRGGNTHVVEIRRDSATPGYRPGPLPAGQWTVQIDTHMVLAGAECHYKLEVTAETDNTSSSSIIANASSVPPFDYVANPNAGWYRGDLHSHTIHSDASWDVPDLVAAARAKGLDFIALTDHNTVSSLAEMASYSTDNFLTLGGQELTTFWGHAVCLGSHDWLDWRVTRDGDEMADIASQLYANEQVYIIAHPKDIGDPYCTGCRWVYPNMMPGTARLVEVWNGAWVGGHELNRDKNVDGLALWYEWLNQGHRLVATAGSDVHGPAGYANAPGFNTIYADELSEKGILRALMAGHSYLSSGPKMTFIAHNANGTRVMMGDTLTVADRSESVRLATEWEGAPTGATIRLIANGKPLEELGISEVGTLGWTISTQQIRWSLLELRAANGDMLALTNPIFFREQ